MSVSLVFLWLGADEPSPSQRAALDAWGAARGVELRAPLDPAGTRPGTRGARYDPRLARSVEQLIDQARISAGALDETAAESQLARAEQELRRAPELPQAAWLMAEVHSLRADLLARRPDSEAASREARDAAALLEGARTTAYEASLGGAPSKGDARGESRELFGLLPSDEIEWDGRPSGATLTAASGEHQVRVLRRGALVWAGWVELAPGQSRVTLTVPVPEPCTALDLGNVGSKRGRAVPPSDVRCPNWALARPAERSSVEIATCQGSECGPWLRWRHDAGVPSVPPDHRHATEPWPVWATYVAAGVGAVLATGLVLWQTGAFDEPEPGSTVWVFGGVAPARR